MIEWVHPGLIFVAAALILPLVNGIVQKIGLLLVPMAAIVSVAFMSPGTYGEFNFANVSLVIGKVDKLALVFAWVFTFMAFIGSLYSLHVKEMSQHVAAYLYIGSALGVVFAGDWFTLLVSWEVMAFASAYLVFASRAEAATTAGFR